MIQRHEIEVLTVIWSEENSTKLMRNVWAKHRKHFGPPEKRPPLRADYPKTGHEVVDELAKFCLEEGDGDFHWGLTSSDVVDAVRMAQVVDSLRVIRGLLFTVTNGLSGWASAQNRDCVGYTHMLAAAPVTMRHRIMVFVEQLNHLTMALPHIVAKPFAGPVGMHGDALWESHKHNLEGRSWQVYCGQTSNGMTYYQVACWLADISRVLYKLAQDMRFLISIGEVKATGDVVGSSSMPHKANPTLWERVCSLAMRQPSYITEMWLSSSTSVLERTLTDSALLRNSLPDMFQNAARQLVDANVALGKYEVDTVVVEAHLKECPNSYEELIQRSAGMPRIDAYYEMKKKE